jgi:hypothetical protein
MAAYSIDLRDPWAKPEDISKPFDCAANFVGALKKRGYVKLGRGSFGTVLAKPEASTVLKVMHNPTDGWLNYVQWASKEGYAGSFAPKVYSYKYIQKGNFGVALMERLDKTLTQVEDAEPASVVPSLFYKHVCHQNETAGNLLNSLFPGIKEFGIKLSQTYKHFDFHGDNYMLRHDGSLVVTDPVAGGATSDYITRMRARDFSLAPLIHSLRTL